MKSLARLWCFVRGHGPDLRFSDLRGAAWTRCSRCTTLTGSQSWHGGEPWLNDGGYVRGSAKLLRVPPFTQRLPPAGDEER